MIFEAPTNYPSCSSETAKYRHLVEKYCYTDDGVPGAGVDVASQGDRVVPWAMSFDLPEADFSAYCGGHPPKGVIHLRGQATNLPFCNESLDFLYSSHLLEDYLEWEPVVREWLRVLRPNGYLIILIPDKTRWAAAIEKGQSPNCSHRHEGEVGELRTLGEKLGLQVVREGLTDLFEGDYTILAVFRKINGGW